MTVEAAGPAGATPRQPIIGAARTVIRSVRCTPASSSGTLRTNICVPMDRASAPTPGR
jgi:hypothetical protein